jgi:hypothetical protein
MTYPATLNVVIAKGLDAALPAAAAAGRLYFATDTKKLYRDNGATWDTMDLTGAVTDYLTQAEGDARYVNVDGDTVTGTINMANAAIVGERGSPGQYTFTSREDGDTSFRLGINAQGDIYFADGTNTADTRLYRSAADTLNTPDALVVGGTLDVTGAVTTASTVTGTRAGGNDYTFQSQVTGDTVPRVRIQADGDVWWSDGSAAVDTKLSRTGVATLEVNGTLNATTALTQGGTGVVLTSDSRLTDARTPTAHATTHEPGGTDAMAVDALAATGSLRTLGTSSTSAAAGNHTHTPTVGLDFIIDGGGSALTAGIKGDVRIPVDMTITGVRLFADQIGSAVVDIWKDSYANYPATVADTITASAKPTLSSALKYEDTTLTGWTTSLTAGDTLRFNVDSASTITRLTVSLSLTRSI